MKSGGSNVTTTVTAFVSLWNSSLLYRFFTRLLPYSYSSIGRCLCIIAVRYTCVAFRREMVVVSFAASILCKRLSISKMNVIFAELPYITVTPFSPCHLAAM